MISIMNPGSAFQAPGLGAGALGKRQGMTEAQFAAGRANWLANGGQDSPQGQNVTPAQLAQMKAGGPVGIANASGTLVGMGGAQGGAQGATAVPNGLRPIGTGQPPAMQGFGATNNLIGQQINPTNSAQTNMAQGMTNTAAQQYANQSFTPFSMNTQRAGVAGANQQMQGLGYNFGQANAAYGQAQGQIAGLQALGTGGFGSGAASANTGRFNSELDGALQGLQGPDRAKLAADAMALMEERSRGDFDRSLREVNAKAAAMGRRGAGMTTNDLGDVTVQREKLLDRSRRDLALDAAQRSLDDRMGVANFQRGIATDRFGAEQFNAELSDRGLSRDQQGRQFGASFQRGLVGDQMALGDRFGDQEMARVGLGERQAGFSRNSAMDDAELAGVERRDEFSRADFGRQRFNDFSGFQRDRESQDRSNRNELRDERGYQYGLSRDAVDDEFRRIDTEENIRTNRFNRGMGTANFGFGAPSPVGAYGAAGGIAAQQSADGYGAAGQLLMQMGANRRRGGAGSGGGAPVASTYSSPAWG